MWVFLFENHFKAGYVKHCVSSDLYQSIPLVVSKRLLSLEQICVSSCPLNKSKNYYWLITQLSLYVCSCDLHHTRILLVHKLLHFSSECLVLWWAYNKLWQSFETFHETFSWKHFIIYKKKVCCLKKLTYMGDINCHFWAYCILK